MTRPTIPWTEYFASVGDVWCVWIVGMLLVGWLMRRAFALRPWRTARAFAADERGASYALGYVMTFPAYLILMCMMIQATLILMVKIGTVYASYAAARSAVVWRPSEPLLDGDADSDARFEESRNRARRAAIVAMTPFASGFKHHLTGSLPLRLPGTSGGVTLSDSWALLEGEAYYRMYRRVARHNAQTDNSGYLRAFDRFAPDATAPREYIVNKYRFATLSTNVDFEEAMPKWNADFPVRVTYRMPMHVPAVSRFFGTRQFGGFTLPYHARDISSVATLPAESAETDSGRLNIPYDPSEFPFELPSL